MGRRRAGGPGARRRRCGPSCGRWTPCRPWRRGRRPWGRPRGHPPPLLLRGTSSVAAVGHAAAKGRLLHTLIEHRVALLAAHTNADAVVGGVSDVLARAVGITGALSPLTTSTVGTGPKASAGWATCPRRPTWPPSPAPCTRAARHGRRRARGGRPAQRIRRVAVCGGAGDSLFDAVRASGADVYVTADLRHHPASEARGTAASGEGRPALVDVSHWASESLWLRARRPRPGGRPGGAGTGRHHPVLRPPQRPLGLPGRGESGPTRGVTHE
ncbi:hypothetical protein GS466_27235 [Rhodococcus hoagii]|nr:hypothetical protein [Prescottella equi]